MNNIIKTQFKTHCPMQHDCVQNENMKENRRKLQNQRYSELNSKKEL